MSRYDRFDFPLAFDVCPSLCRELNEINRKHIQDSVALIRKVRSYRHGARSEIPKTPTPCLVFDLSWRRLRPGGRRSWS